MALSEEPWIDSSARSIETFLHDKFGRGNTGMVVGLIDEHGRRVFAAGKLGNGTDRTVDAETVFEIGSVTKIFTALLLVDAVRRGEVQLDDPLARHLPPGVRVPSRNGKEITLLNLAVQDSGLPFFPDNLIAGKLAKDLTLEDKKIGSDAYTVEKMYESLAQFELAQNPGARYEYSNVGMAVLGHALERATGSDFESLVVDRICRPLKMVNTRITLAEGVENRFATGHLNDGARAEHWRLQAMAPAGALRSTADDLLTFLAANLALTDSELTPLLEQMQVFRHAGAPVFGRSAMPWVDEGVYNPPGSELLGHAGGGYGTIAFVAFDRLRRRGVVVLTNQMNVYPQGVAWTLLQGYPLTEHNVPVREVVGVGMALELDPNTGLPRITKVFPKSPAGELGIAVGLAIRRIDDEALEGKPLSECVTLLSGAADTKVRLELLDLTEGEQTTVELTRKRFLTIEGENARIGED
jgi:CubicO group peptidase (beta-lactamase class C family)